MEQVYSYNPGAHTGPRCTVGRVRSFVRMSLLAAPMTPMVHWYLYYSTITTEMIKTTPSARHFTRIFFRGGLEQEMIRQYPHYSTADHRLEHVHLAYQTHQQRTQGNLQPVTVWRGQANPLCPPK